jgi:alpha-tubulin suppressor-like RCC1 family protein
MTTGYQINGTDTDDLFVRKDLFSEGGLWVCGGGGTGALGTNDTANRSSPVQTVAGGTNWKQVDKSNSHNGAIKTDGTLWVWGEGTNGALGTNDTANRSSPVQTIAGGTNWKQVSCGNRQTAAIKTDGTLWIWGLGSDGQLGTNDLQPRSSPVQTIAGGTNWKQVSIGASYTASIKTDGTLWVWGGGTFGELGTNDTANRSSPVQTIAGGTNWKQVGCGNSHTAAIKTDGTLWIWGNNVSGRLGTNDTDRRSSPVQTIAGGTNWKQVSVGGTNSNMTAAIKTDGTLWVWGSGNNGQLGTNDLEPRSSPVQTIAGGTNWKQVVAGDGQVQAIKTDGTLWTWGGNSGGQLGINDTVHRSSPVQVGADTDWKTVGGSSGLRAIREDYWA